MNNIFLPPKQKEGEIEIKERESRWTLGLSSARCDSIEVPLLPEILLYFHEISCLIYVQKYEREKNQSERAIRNIGKIGKIKRITKKKIRKNKKTVRN